MTHMEMTDKVLAAYRQGYLDGMADRPAVPAQSVAVPAPGMAAADGGVLNDDVFAMYNQAIANLMGFDGTPQETVEQSLMRTKQK
jgi:hypothetical protein